MKKFLPTSTSLSVNKKGFTLIELLVVVAIISILMVIAISVYAGVQRKTRDARRQAEIDALAKSMEIRKNATTGVYIYTGVEYNQDYPSTKPTDPISITSYCYVSPKPGSNPAAWASGCPVGYSAIPSAAGSTIIASPGVTSWMICANYEASIGVFCKGSLN